VPKEGIEKIGYFYYGTGGTGKILKKSIVGRKILRGTKKQ